MSANGLRAGDNLLLLQALFPYASPESLSDGIAMARTVEEAVWRVHSTMNPDLYSAAYLVQEGKKAKLNAAAGRPKRAFSMVPQLLFSRLATVEESALTGISLNHEYSTVIRAFPIDTAAWDEHFIATTTLTDIVGGRPLVLPEDDNNDGFLDQCNVTRAPILRWAPTATATATAVKGGMKESKKQSEENNLLTKKQKAPVTKMLVSKDKACEDFPTVNGQSNAAGGGDQKGSASLADSVMSLHAVPTPVEFCLQKETEWYQTMDQLAPWENVFGVSDTCNLCREVVRHCKGLVSMLPELVPTLLRVIEEELRGVEIVPATCGLYLKELGGIVLDFEAIRIREVSFGRSYVKLDDDGSYMDVSVKTKRFILEPLLFSYQKSKNKGYSYSSTGGGGGGNSTSGIVNVKIMNVKVKAVVNVNLLASGQVGVRCRKPRVTINSLRTKCTITKLHIIGIFLRPIIRRKLKEALQRFLAEGINAEKI